MQNYCEVSSKMPPRHIAINWDSIAEAIGGFVFLCGIVVMIGWFFNIGVLKSILPVWVSMKFSTAFSFSLSGILLYFIARFKNKNSELAVIILPITSSIILLLMMTLLASTVIGMNVGVEEMFVKDSTTAVKSVTPGRPSIAAMINFIFIAMAGFLTPLDFKRFNRTLMIIGVLVGLIGLTAVFGYILNRPLLYFAVTGKCSAMACNTAILFIAWGLGLILIERDK
jgi:hypothetical protein